MGVYEKEAGQRERERARRRPERGTHTFYSVALVRPIASLALSRPSRDRLPPALSPSYC